MTGLCSGNASSTHIQKAIPSLISNGASASSSPQAMIRKAMAAPYLERNEERDLAVRWKKYQDQDALHRITTAHMRLVISMAGKFRKFKLPMNDLIQEGYVGLLEAAARFEPERNVRFSTYASWWIRASMQDYILRNWSIVRNGTSSTQKALFFNLRRLRSRLAQGNEELTKNEIYQQISDQLGVSQKDVEMLDNRMSAPDTSLSASLGTDGDSQSSKIDFLVDDRPLQDEIVENTIDVERRTDWLTSAMTSLNEREKHIIRERRLANDAITLEALGEKLGISKERVRQIESRAMEKLKTALLQDHGETAFQV